MQTAGCLFFMVLALIAEFMEARVDGIDLGSLLSRKTKRSLVVLKKIHNVFKITLITNQGNKSGPGKL